MCLRHRIWTIQPLQHRLLQAPAADKRWLQQAANESATVWFVIEKKHLGQAYADVSRIQATKKSFESLLQWIVFPRDTNTFYKIYIDKAMAPADTAKPQRPLRTLVSRLRLSVAENKRIRLIAPH